MDFREKRSEAKLIRVGFREAKNETRREKRAKSVFRAKTILAANFFHETAKNRTKTRTKLCFMKKKHFFRKNFSQNCENHPIFGVRNAAY